MINTAIQIHIIFIIALFFVIVRNLYLLISIDDFVSVAKKIRFITPIFHLCISAILYTGITIQFYLHTFTDIVMYIMIFATIFIMVAEIKRYKRQRVIKSNDYELQNEFRLYAKKIYFIDLGIIIFIFGLVEVMK